MPPYPRWPNYPIDPIGWVLLGLHPGPVPGQPVGPSWGDQSPRKQEQVQGSYQLRYQVGRSGLAQV